MRQIATQLDLSEKTVENQIARAMVYCRQRLRDASCLR
jgi:RNA polymerase sigma-70 factor (ECF subfamily)